MTRIRKDLSVKLLAAAISEALATAGIEAVLSGGSVVSIYTENAYESSDLDFITFAGVRQLAPVLEELGFSRVDRHFEHPECEYLIEFPPAPLMAGNLHIDSWAQIETSAGTLQILTPTQCVMDRLAAFYHWTDRQCLDQALKVARSQPVDLGIIEQWSRDEGHHSRFLEFKAAL